MHEALKAAKRHFIAFRTHILRGLSGSLYGSFVHTSCAASSSCGCGRGAITAAVPPRRIDASGVSQVTKTAA